MVPYALQNRPELEGRLEFYMQVFHRLSRSRGWSDHGVPQPIPVSEIFSYCDGLSIRSIELRETLLDHVQALDSTYCKLRSPNADSGAKPDVVNSRSPGDNP